MSGAAIRRAQPLDAAELARLAGHLGYAMSVTEMARRLAALLSDDRHLVAVAAAGGALRGWVHVEHRFSLEGGERAELLGLVIDANCRRGGLGREPVGLAEAWALARGMATTRH